MYLCRKYTLYVTYFECHENIDSANMYISLFQYKTIRRTVEVQSISRYSDFGEELEKKYKNSILIKLINRAYASYPGDSNIIKSMIELEILQEITKTRIELVCKIFQNY